MNKKGFEFALSGFIIALILVSMLTVVSAVFFSELSVNYNMSMQNSTLGLYNKTTELLEEAEKIRDTSTSTGTSTQTIYDILGSFFSSGLSAIKTSLNSITLFDAIMNQASGDIEGFSLISRHIFAMILIGIFLGLIIALIVKWKV